MMDDLPLPGFTAIDVGDPVFDSDLLSRRRDMPLSDAQFAGWILARVDAWSRSSPWPP